MKMLKKIYKLFAVLFTLIIIYALGVFILPYISVPAEETDQAKEVDIYILTNGVHTDIVVPIKNEVFDWSRILPFENTVSKSTNFNYVSIGWGDKGFYLDTPTWSELKPSTAFKAAFWLGESAMHCTYYNNMQEGEDCVKIPITEDQYRRLVTFINNKFDKNPQGKVQFIPTNAVYGDNDAFYDAKSSYNLFYTCNTWANDALKSAGQKAALWTALDFGIFTHYKE